MWLVVNAVAVVASVAAYSLYLVHTWRGHPETGQSSRRQVTRFLALSVVAALLLVLLSIRLKHDITTLDQTGSLLNIGRGVQDVYYAIPYETTPNLEFIQNVRNDRFTRGPEVVEQRPDGFRVQVDLDTWHYNWRARGLSRR